MEVPGWDGQHPGKRKSKGNKTNLQGNQGNLQSNQSNLPKKANGKYDGVTGPNGEGSGVAQPKTRRMTLYSPPPGVPIFLHAHSMPPLKDWVPFITGYEPVYLAGYGNATLITLENGAQNVFAPGPAWVHKAIHRYYGMDDVELRRKYQDYIQMSQSVPIIIPPRKLVLFAVKTRVPQHHNDGATGYAANTAVESLEFISHKKTRLHLKTGHYMDVLMSIKAVRRRQRNAEMFAFLLHRDGIL